MGNKVFIFLLLIATGCSGSSTGKIFSKGKNPGDSTSASLKALLGSNHSITSDDLSGDLDGDLDGDGIPNSEDPNSNSPCIPNDAFEAACQDDSDNDFLRDFEEIHVYGTDPFNAYTDGENLFNDGEQVLLYGVNPKKKDSDDDYIDDEAELVLGFNPTRYDDFIGNFDFYGWLATIKRPVISTDLPDKIVLSEGDGLNLKIEVEATNEPIIKWYFSHIKDDYIGKLLFAKGTSFSRESIKPEMDGYIWAQIHNPLGYYLIARDTPYLIQTNKVRVEVNSNNPQECEAGFPHGSLQTRTMYQEGVVEFRRYPLQETEKRRCINGKWTGYYSKNNFQFESFRFLDCDIESHEDCSFFDNVRVVFDQDQKNITQNNVGLSINCPVGHRFDATGDLCTGEDQHYELAYKNGDQKLFLGFYRLEGSGGYVKATKSIKFVVNASDSLQPNINIDYIQNINTEDGQSIPMRYFDKELTEGVVDTYEGKYEVLNAFPYGASDAYWNYNDTKRDLVWNDNRLTRNLDLSGVSWFAEHPGTAIGFSWQASATLISDRHVVFARHWTPKPGAILNFFARGGEKVEAEVVATKAFTPHIAGDVSVGLIRFLNPADSSKLKRYKMIDWRHRLIGGSQLISTTQHGHLSIQKAEPKILSLTSNQLFYNQSWDAPFDGARRGLQIYDSGNPVFAVVKGEMALVATHYNIASGANYTQKSVQEQIQRHMTQLDRENDSDGDGVTDYWEVKSGSNPILYDPENFSRLASFDFNGNMEYSTGKLGPLQMDGSEKYEDAFGGRTAFEFDGSTTLKFAMPPTSLQGLTVCTWLKPGEKTGLVWSLKSEDETTHVTLIQHQINLYGKFHLLVADYGIPKAAAATRPGPYLENGWTHVCGVFGTKTFSFYKNGVKHGSADFGFISKPLTKLVVGSGYIFYNDFNFTGLMESFQVFEVPLGASAILDLYQKKSTDLTEEPPLRLGSF